VSDNAAHNEPRHNLKAKSLRRTYRSSSSRALNTLQSITEPKWTLCLRTLEKAGFLVVIHLRHNQPRSYGSDLSVVGDITPLVASENFLGLSQVRPKTSDKGITCGARLYAPFVVSEHIRKRRSKHQYENLTSEPKSVLPRSYLFSTSSFNSLLLVGLSVG
jgi:hypothetical protein